MNKSIKKTKIQKMVGAREFLSIYSGNRDSILESKIVMPILGRPGLGGFKITLNK